MLPTVGLDGPEWPPAGWVDGGGHIAVDLRGCGPFSRRVLQRTAPEQLIGFRCPQARHLAGLSWHPDEHEVDRWCRLVSWAGGPCGREDLLLRQAAADGRYLSFIPVRRADHGGGLPIGGPPSSIGCARTAPDRHYR